MSGDDRSTGCVMTWRREWAAHLFSFRTERPEGLVFAPGQFVRLGLAGADGAMVWRAYSIVSPPAAPHLEFYSIVVPDGPFTQPLARMSVGDSIRIDPTVYGFLRADRFADGCHLWLLATGTGIAPFVSIVEDAAAWRRFERIVVVHSVRCDEELAYRERFHALVDGPLAGGATLTYLPTLTGRSGETGGRITTRLADGGLESAAGLRIDTSASRLMICGNPTMIRETRALLGVRGLLPVRRETPGHYVAENFW